ncbi:MAG: transposase [Desulfovibrio sp.]|nr:transposase [Desulfovibrio sp.]
MSSLFYLSVEQPERIRPRFPLSHDISRVDDMKVTSGIIYVIKHGLQWKEAPHEYGPYKILHTRFIHWSPYGSFQQNF